MGRYGGEEFLIVLTGCDRSTTHDRAEHFRALIGGHPVESAEGNITVTLSMGGVASGDWPGADANTLLHAADAALYRAKHAGRNRVELAVPGEIPVPVSEPGVDGIALPTQES